MKIPKLHRNQPPIHTPRTSTETNPPYSEAQKSSPNTQCPASACTACPSTSPASARHNLPIIPFPFLPFNTLRIDVLPTATSPRITTLNLCPSLLLCVSMPSFGSCFGFLDPRQPPILFFFLCRDLSGVWVFRLGFGLILFMRLRRAGCLWCLGWFFSADTILL